MAFLDRFKYAGASELPEYDVQRGVCIGVNLMCMSIIVLNVLSGVGFYVVSHNLSVILGALGEAALITCVIRLNGKRHYEWANSLFYFLIVVSTFYFCAILGKDSEAQLMILFILGLSFFLFRKPINRWICMAIALLLLVALEANFAYHFISPAPFTRHVGFLIRYLVYGVVISLVLLIFYLYNKNTRLVIQLYSYSKSLGASLKSEERLNEIKNLFFQSISHDIRGSYYGVSGICQAIEDLIKEGKPISEHIATQLMEASDHYKFMLNNFLEVSKFKDATIDNLYLEVFDLREEVEKIAEIHKYVANLKHVRIEMTFSFGFPEKIVGDKLKITRIIYNLLSNALKFTANYSTVKITVEHFADTWMLTVTDQGKGIASGKLKKIFLPYETEISPLNPEGVGLGLYITKYLADILGATISARNQQGAGACFEVQFPLIKQLVTA